MNGVNVVSIIKEILDKERCVPKESLATLLLKRGVAESTVRKKLGEYIQRAGLQVRWIGSQEWVCLPGETPDKGIKLGVSSGIELGVKSRWIEKVEPHIRELISGAKAGTPAIRELFQIVREIEERHPCFVESVWPEGMHVYLYLHCISENGNIVSSTVPIEDKKLADELGKYVKKRREGAEVMEIL